MKTLTIELVATPTEDARVLVAELEDLLAAEYPAEARHGLELAAIFRPHIRFYIAQLDRVAIGCGGVALMSDHAELKRMYVRERARGTGAAEAILARLEDEARVAGLTVLRLETGDRQRAAIRFYERVGVRRCGAFGEYATMSSSAVASSVFFEKTLSPEPPR
jgi:putative acetyltransferase